MDIHCTPRLDVNIATHGPQGAEAIVRMDLPKVEGVRYVVSWQLPADFVTEPLPRGIRRDDIVVSRVDCRGVTGNRNNALARSSAPVVLIADNDLSYTAEALREVIDVFERHPEVDMAVFRYDGDPRQFPSVEMDIGRRMPKGFHVASMQMAFRREAVKRAGLHFDERFGPGAPRLKGCDDDVFFLAARKAGLAIRYFPLVVTTHPGPSSGYLPISNTGFIEGMGAYIRLEWPVTSPLRIMLKAWRMWRCGQAPLFMSLKYLWRGYFHIGALMRRESRQS